MSLGDLCGRGCLTKVATGSACGERCGQKLGYRKKKLRPGVNGAGRERIEALGGIENTRTGILLGE